MTEREQEYQLRMFDRVRLKAGGPLMWVHSLPGTNPVRCRPVETSDAGFTYLFFDAGELELVMKSKDVPRPGALAFAALRAHYPHLVQPGFSFECREGWIGVLRRYFDEVAAAVPDGRGFRLHSVKSRFGVLTVDASMAPGTADEIEEAIEKASMRAEARSNHWCAACGNPGRAREGEWESASCDEHAGGVMAVPPDETVFTHGHMRFVYDDEADDVVPLTPERAAGIPWLDDERDPPARG
jgi:hypothetical protein